MKTELVIRFTTPVVVALLLLSVPTTRAQEPAAPPLVKLLNNGR
jgi:hypothetical protein